MADLCAWFGISRQAYYKHFRRIIQTSVQEEVVLKKVLEIRENHKRIGTRKLYLKLDGFFSETGIKMGRDALFSLLSTHRLLIRKRKRKMQTTYSNHWLRKYPNLIREFIPTAPNQLWVSDITYWKINNQYLYISFITDAYSHKIVGYHLAKTLKTIESLKALKMALSGLGPERHFPLTHHSDRGIQYCSSEYVELLKQYNIHISMTENGDPLENPIAERINGIIKEEYLYPNPVGNFSTAKEILIKGVSLYNSDRLHLSLGYRIPDEVHYAQLPIKFEKAWRSYYKSKKGDVNPYQDQNDFVNLRQD